MSTKIKTGITIKLWLFMLEHGGRWTVAELSEQFKHSTDHIQRILWSMDGVGSVTRYRGTERKNGAAFGVTMKNRIPQRMVLADVVAAAGVRRVIENHPASNDSGRRTASLA